MPYGGIVIWTIVQSAESRAYVTFGEVRRRSLGQELGETVRAGLPRSDNDSTFAGEAPAPDFIAGALPEAIRSLQPPLIIFGTWAIVMADHDDCTIDGFFEPGIPDHVRCELFCAP